MTDDERTAILERCEGLRTTDVNDGMDHCGLQDVGMVAWDIRPLWRDVETLAHRFYGFAHTVRFLPTNRRAPTMSPEAYAEFMGRWYRDLAQGPLTDQIRPGDAIAIDGHETGTGFIGSNNAQRWMNCGALGVVTNGACRDSGVMVRPGDLVVADGDGVIVVPIDHVECVLAQARRIANGDRAGRRKLFADAGREQDDTTAELA